MAKNSKLPGWPDMLQPPFAGLAAGFGQGDRNAFAAPGLAGGMDFMKSLWGGKSSSVPGFVLPTLDINELDKRIEDLRSVESWLTLNANVLKATIQGLEVQRNTLAALQALREKGDFLSAMMNPAAAPSSHHSAAERHQASGNEETASVASAAQMKSREAFAEAFRKSFGAGAGNPNWPLPVDPAGAISDIADDEAPPESPEPLKVKKSARKKAHKSRAKASSSAVTPLPAGQVQTSAAQSANIWLNFLKDQFGQIANAALVAPPSVAPVRDSSHSAAPRASSRTAVRASSKTTAHPIKKLAAKRPVRRQMPGAKD